MHGSCEPTFACPFNILAQSVNNICQYTVEVTKVFKGNNQVVIYASYSHKNYCYNFFMSEFMFCRLVKYSLALDLMCPLHVETVRTF